MKRKFLKTVATSLVLALIFSISSFMFIAGAETVSSSGECGDNVSYSFNEVTGELRIYGTGDMDNYDTFTMFEWYHCSPWFYDRDFVKKVVVEEGVTSIGSSAFEDCGNLISIDMPKSIKSIGYGAFANCKSLENIVIPEGVETIGDWVFYESGNLKTVSIPKSVTSLGDECFYYCTALEEITVDSENPNYSSDEYGVLFDKNKTVLLRYPSGNKRTSYTVPESVVKIDTAAFVYAENLENIVFGNELKLINMEAFTSCNRLTELEFPGSLNELGLASFAYCENLESVTFSEGVKTIDYSAFSGCKSLATINLADSLEEIGMNAFNGTAFFENEENWENGVLYNGKHLIIVDQSVDGIFEIKEGTILIADFAFSNCKKITEVIIPDSLRVIGSSSFSGCNGLTDIKISASVKIIGSSAFSSCDGFTSFTVPETVTSLGRAAFNNCENLESVEIKANITTIESSMFSCCTKLTSVKLSDTIKTIDDNAFNDCDSLETLELPKNLETIKKSAFESSDALTYVTFPESLVTIGERAFYSTNINSVFIPKNVTSIDKCAFAYTSNLTSIEVDEENTAFMTDGKALYSKDGTRLLYCFADNDTVNYIIPDGTTIIDDNAFCERQNIEAVTIPSSVTNASGALFGGCKNLKSVALDAQIKTIGNYSFEGCTSLKKVYFSSSVKEIIFRAFYGCTNLSDIYFGGTEEEWNKISGVKNDSVLSKATIHYNHVHAHTYIGYTEATADEPGFKLFACECGHYYAEYDKVIKSDKYDVSATYHPDCFNEEITLDVEVVTGSREPGGIYMVDGKTYVQVGVYNLKAVNEDGEVVQPNEGYKVKLKITIPDEYKDKTDMVIYHRFVDGGREKLATSDGTLTIQNGYMIFEVTKFSEFEILAGTADMTVSKLPDKLNYIYKGTLDLSGIELKITDIDGSVEYVADTSKMTVEGFDSTKLGTQTVTVRYEQYSCIFEVTVSYAWWQWIIRILLLGFLWY